MSLHGLLVLDKPSGITSRAAVDRAAKWFPRKTKIGHAGTLDPLATGVLVLAIGQATRLIEYVQAMPKVYRTRIRLGGTSDTDDADGTITVNTTADIVDESVVRDALTRFVGTVEQVPPAYSAAHVEGRRAHTLARQGEEVKLTARPVRIDRIDMREYLWPSLEIDVFCGKGTYIRSIARDLGQALGVGGYVTELRRMSIGAFSVDNAVPLDVDAAAAQAKLLPLTTAVGHLPTIAITAEQARCVRMGQAIDVDGAGSVAATDEAGHLVAIGTVANGRLRPDKVMVE
ncbi:MAG TPA: tRNA pseudouridine(55) synthase TruB [Gemmataceae bacterium]|jgi:tRNA pseudouridine55 synthase|nr:tRNA pseudouridine(55) synthase TruB [Gemmataceae bacterium]